MSSLPVSSLAPAAGRAALPLTIEPPALRYVPSGVREELRGPLKFTSARQDEPASRRSLDVGGKSVYLIGIGGCGMSGLARMLRSRGAIVSGSDMNESEVTDALVAEGIEVGFDQKKRWLPDRCEMVICSAAIKADHPQVLEARGRGLPVLFYAEALGLCMLGRTGVAIAGTHGKSSTTAMLGTALTDAGINPTVIVGATVGQLATGSLGTAPRPAGSQVSGFRLGADVVPAGTFKDRPGVLVAESCEFNRSFHNLHPTIASISSVEADHLDMYGTFEAVVESFREFARLIPPAAEGGKLLIAHEGAHRREVAAGLACEVETIGFSPEADWVVGYEPETRSVSLRHGQDAISSWAMRIPGAHNAMNAATAMVLATWLGANPEVVGRSLAAFAGVDRRNQLLGERRVGAGTIRVYDDYGHHPTEIDATLRALRAFEKPESRGGRLICVFQPHQHSRTRHLLEEFTQSFGGADVVLVPDIYFVRDSAEERAKIGSQDLVQRLVARGVEARHIPTFGGIVGELERIGRPGDLVVVMGAGPVYEVGRDFIARGA